MADAMARRPRGAALQGEGSAAADPPQLSESGLNLFSLMEDINDRLKLLHYESRFLQAKPTLMLRPLHRLYFALPSSASEQFPYFSHLITWLFSLIQRELLDWNDFDDPSTIADSISQQLRKCGCTVDCSAGKLRSGSGETVVLALDWITALALQQSGFVVHTPVYGTGEAAAAVTMDAGTEGGDDDDDAVLDTVEDDGAVVDDDDSLTASLSDPFTAISRSQPIAPPPPPSISASAWALEFEQAAPLLRSHPQPLSNKEYRSHHDAAIKHSALLSSLLASTRPELSSSSLLLRKQLERIAAKEKLLNREHEALVAEMRQLQQQQETVGTDSSRASEELGQLGGRLREAEAETEAMKERIGRRNELMTDGSAVRRVAAVVKELRREVLQLEVRIGVMSQSVSAMRLRRQREKEQRKGREDRERQSRQGGHAAQHSRMDKQQQHTPHSSHAVRYDY